MPRTIRAAVTLLVVCIFALPGVVRAQQSGKIQRIGMITMLPIPVWRTLGPSQAFLTRLHELGYDEGRNIAVEHRSAEGNLKRLPDVAAEVVGLNVDVILENVCDASLKAAMAATRKIPIVVAACNDDMVETGIIASLAHPGGNVTGLNKMTPQLNLGFYSLDVAKTEASYDAQKGLLLVVPVSVFDPDKGDGKSAGDVKVRVNRKNGNSVAIEE